MASKYWIKLYHEILQDPKMGRLPDNVWRRAIELFLLAGELDEDGKLPETEEIAWLLRQSGIGQLETELAHLERVKILTRTPSGWLVTKFADRQAAVADADRMKEYRKRKRLGQFSSPEAENEPVTEPLPDENEPVTNPVTKRNTDIESDKDIEERERESAPTHVRDPLTDIVILQQAIEEEPDSYPQDQYFEYSNELLAIYQEMTGKYPDQVIKDQIPELEKAGVTPTIWRRAWEDCLLNWSGNGKVPVSRVIEVAHFGGSWKKWKQSKFPDSANGRDSPQQSPKTKVIFTPVSQESTEEI